MRTFHNLIAALASLISGAAALMASMPYLTANPGDLGYVLFFVAAAALLAFWIALIPLQALTIWLSRGPGHVAWVPPSACSSFSSWLACDWRFFGKGGAQEGMRILGLEMAFAGQLS